MDDCLEVSMSYVMAEQKIRIVFGNRNGDVALISVSGAIENGRRV